MYSDHDAGALAAPWVSSTEYGSNAKVFMKVLMQGLLGAVLWTSGMEVRAQEPSLQAGAFNEEQALRGQALYYAHCLQCHGESLGGVDKAPPLAGPQFSSVWNGVPLATLVARIATMPPEKPGSLTRGESVDVLSYLLWFNGLPLGDKPLGTEQELLNQLKFESPPAAQ